MDIFSVVGDCDDVKNIIENYSRTPSKEWFDNIEKIKYAIKEIKNIIFHDERFLNLNAVQQKLNEHYRNEQDLYYENLCNDLITCYDRKNFYKSINSKQKRLHHRYNSRYYTADINFIENLDIDKNKKFY